MVSQTYMGESEVKEREPRQIRNTHSTHYSHIIHLNHLHEESSPQIKKAKGGKKKGPETYLLREGGKARGDREIER